MIEQLVGPTRNSLSFLRYLLHEWIRHAVQGVDGICTRIHTNEKGPLMIILICVFQRYNANEHTQHGYGRVGDTKKCSGDWIMHRRKARQGRGSYLILISQTHKRWQTQTRFMGRISGELCGVEVQKRVLVSTFVPSTRTYA